MTSKFSVLMCLYDGNSVEDINNSIYSINHNSLQPHKVVLVVDGPLSDAKRETLTRLTEGKRYEVIWKERNSGLIDALNIGLKYVDTEWCVRCDCDDYNHPNRFQELAKHFDKKNTALVGSYVSEVGWRTKVQRQVPTDHSDIIKLMVWRNPFNHMSVAFRTTVVRSLGSYPNIYGREDYALWVMLADRGWTMVNLDQDLVTVTAGSEMLKRRSGMRHLLAECKLLHLKLRTSTLSNFGSFIAFVMRCIAITAPVVFKEIVWMRFRK